MFSGALGNLIEEFSKLPGVGPKSAQRLAFHLLRVPRQDAAALSQAIIDLKDLTSLCTTCFNVAEGSQLCEFCLSEKRQNGLVCVVEDPRDVAAVERTHKFAGRYHVLGGVLSPLEGIGPEQLRIKELLYRVEGEQIEEIILCTNPTVEGETTGMYLSKLLKPLGVTVTKIASGIPVGGDLEYADELTLGRALEGRSQLGN